MFCEEHGRISKVEHKTQIICSVNGHHLAFGFPYDRIWEFCCDCEVFQSSKLAKGKVETECRVCKRRTVRRYMCHNCQTISFESDQTPRGKHEAVIQKTNEDLLFCAGCFSGAGKKNLLLHKCENLRIDFLTTKMDCLFCHRKITVSSEIKTNNFTAAAKSKHCTNRECGQPVNPIAVFCPYCGILVGEAENKN
jgi:hypothetical protein